MTASLGTDPTDWRDPGWTVRFPQLSTAERDRRFDLVRKLMIEADLACIVLASPGQGHDFLGHYFSGMATPTVVLPRDGAPVAFQDGVTSPTAARDLDLDERWIRDWRLDEGPHGIAGHLRDSGLAGARIGIVGHSTVWPTSFYLDNGGEPWNRLSTTHRMAQLLPTVDWVDVWPALLPLVAVKSDEELSQFTKAAHLAHRAAEIFLTELAIGRTAADATAVAVADVFRHGGYTPTGATPFADRRPLRRGDTVQTEIIVYVGAAEAQACVTASLGPPSRPLARLIEAAEESYDLGRAAVRPGLTLRELQDVMAAPLRRIGAWGTPPLFHGLNPIYGQSDVGRCREQDVPGLRERFFPDLQGPLPHKPIVRPEFTLAPGMTVHLEPNGQTVTDGVTDTVFLGGDLLVTETGAREFSSTSTHAHVLTG